MSNTKKCEKNDKKRKNLTNYAVLLGVMGFLVAYLGVSTDDARTIYNDKTVAPQKTTNAMVFGGMASMAGAVAVLWYRNKKYKNR